LTVISISVHHFFVVSILGCVHPRNAEVGNVQVFCINKVFVMKKKEDTYFGLLATAESVLIYLLLKDDEKKNNKVVPPTIALLARSSKDVC